MAKVSRLERLEREVPERARAAIKKAYLAAKRSGRAMVVAKDGKLWQVNGDGEWVLVRAITGRSRVTKGSKLKVK
jgi:hypothetical protein